MADRNLTNRTRYGQHMTKEGMLVDIPISDAFVLKGIPATIDPFSESSVQLFPLGTKLTYADRVFRYALNGGTGLAVGKGNQSVVPLAGHIDEVIGSTALAAVQITFTPNTQTTDDLALNELADGYIHINDDTGEGYMYRIKSHPAIVGAVSGLITLYDPILLAHGANATGTVYHNKFQSVILHPSPPTAPIIGVSVIPVTASYYHWEQVTGPCAVLTDGTLVIGEDIVASDATDGAFEAADGALTGGNSGTPDTGHGERHLGYVQVLNATAEYTNVYLEIEK